MAAIITAVAAVVVFVVTQIFLKFVLEPIQEQKKLIGEVAHALLFYANVYRIDAWGPKRTEEARRSKKPARLFEDSRVGCARACGRSPSTIC